MDTELLTSVLRTNGHLDKAIVLAVELTPMQTNGIGSEFFTARLRYSSADHQLPDRMVVKRPLLGDRGQGEANVYELVLRGEAGLPLMRYFGAIDEDAGKPLSLLFEDLSGSHHQTSWPIIPGLADCRRAVAALADVHGRWWGRTETICAGTPPVVAHQAISHLTTFFSKFVDFVGEYLSPARLDSYERVFTGFDRLLAGRLNADNTTLLHTDPHFWNFLYPNDPEQDQCVLFDWPLWRTGLAGSDLAYMIGLHLYPEHRRRFEPTLLHHYWHRLCERGVSCELADVRLDYRYGIIAGLLMPVMEFSWKIPPLDWMPKLEKAFSAYDDLECRELLAAV